MSGPAPLPASLAERRGVLRHPVQVAGIISCSAGPAITVTLTDISEHGCQIERSADLPKGATIGLSFAGFAPVDATVVWSSPRAHGLHFDQPLHHALVERVVQVGRGRRRSPRLLTPGLVRRQERERQWHVSLAVQLEDQAGPARSFAGILSDLSMEGCRIASAVAVLPGAALTVALPGHPPLAAIACWCQNGAIGLKFAQALDAAAVEQIARR